MSDDDRYIITQPNIGIRTTKNCGAVIENQKNIFITNHVGGVAEVLSLYLSWFGLGKSQTMTDT